MDKRLSMKEQKEMTELEALKKSAEENLRFLMQLESFKALVDKLWVHEEERGIYGMWKACDSIVLKLVSWETATANGMHLLRFMKNSCSLDIWEQQSGSYSSFSRPIRDTEFCWGKELEWWRTFKDILEKLSDQKSAIDFFYTLRNVEPLGVN